MYVKWLQEKHSSLSSRNKTFSIDSVGFFPLQVIRIILLDICIKIHLQVACLVKHCFLCFIFKTAEWLYSVWAAFCHTYITTWGECGRLTGANHTLHAWCTHQMSPLTPLRFHELHWHCHEVQIFDSAHFSMLKA